MGERRRNRSGGKLLIVVALGPICAVAADLPGRVAATPIDPVPGFGIQTLERAEVARADVATVSKASSVRKQQNSQHPAVHIDLPESTATFTSLSTRLAESADDSVLLYWLENPTSAGP